MTEEPLVYDYGLYQIKDEERGLVPWCDRASWPEPEFDARIKDPQRKDQET